MLADVVTPHAPAGVRMPFVECREARLFYETSGSGDPVVWLPGTGLRGSTWQAQVGALRDRYTCVTVDLPGSGSSELPKTPTVAAMAADVADLLDAVVPAPAHLVGLSMGAAVAQEVALQRPDLVRSLALVATWSSTAREHHIRRHFESRLFALEKGPIEVFAQFAFWMSAPSIVDEEPENQARVEALLAEHTSAWPEGTASHFRVDLSHETRDRLGAITCPALIVHGDEDLITLPRYNRAVADAIPGARLTVIPRAGHLAWIEREDEVTAALREFFAETERTDAAPAAPVSERTTT